MHSFRTHQAPPRRSARERETQPDQAAADEAAYLACLETIRQLREENAILRESADQFAALAERLQHALARERARALREGHSSTGHHAQETLLAVTAQIEAEYRAVPNLRLTRWQAARLWDLDQAVCDQAIATLVQQRVLRETPGGFVRRDP